jgi:hypothetical protein
MSEQVARAVSAETTAQANRIEQMFGQVMADVRIERVPIYAYY